MDINNFINLVKNEIEEFSSFDELLEKAEINDKEAMYKLGLLFERLWILSSEPKYADSAPEAEIRETMEYYMYNSADLGFEDAKQWINDYYDDDGRWDAYI